jgi:hypothetical protein
MKFSKFIKISAAILLASTAINASASTYSNSNDDSIGPFGQPNTTNYGEVFTSATAGVLTDWTFFANSGSGGNLDLVVSAWDGLKAVGPSLYTSSNFAYTGGSKALTFSGINTSITAGTSYIAYLTVANVSSAASGVVIASSNSNGGIGNGFSFLNSSGIDPLTLSTSWANWSPLNMTFSANISDASPVPVPAAIWMFGSGLIGLGAMRKMVHA